MMVPSLVIKDIVGLNQPNFPLKDDSVLWRARLAIRQLSLAVFVT